MYKKAGFYSILEIGGLRIFRFQRHMEEKRGKRKTGREKKGRKLGEQKEKRNKRSQEKRQKRKKQRKSLGKRRKWDNEASLAAKRRVLMAFGQKWRWRLAYYSCYPSLFESTLYSNKQNPQTRGLTERQTVVHINTYRLRERNCPENSSTPFGKVALCSQQ